MAISLLERGVGNARSVLPWLLYATLCIPLVIAPGLFYPFVAGKEFVFHTLGIIAGGLFLYAALGGAPFFWARLRSWKAWIPAMLLGVEYLTSLFGLGFSQSFWGTAIRGGGLLTTSISIGFFYLMLLIADERVIKRAFLVVLIVGGIEAVVGLVQWLAYLAGAVPTFFPAGGDRVGGLFGNAIFLAGYLALAGFAALAFAEWFPRTRVRRFIIGLAALMFTVVVVTATRGAVLALSAALVTALCARAFQGSSRARAALAGIALLAVLLVAFRNPLSHVPFEPLARLESISLSDPTTASRLFVWNGVLGEALKRPLVGVGAEHITQLFDRVYDPTKLSEEWFDRSHNTFLDYFAQFGLIGLTLYLLLVGLVIVPPLRQYLRGKERAPLYLALAGIAYAVSNFFAFDTTSSFFLLLLLFSYTLLHPGMSSRSLLLRESAALRIVGVVLGAALLLMLYPVVWRPLIASRSLVIGYLYQVSDVSKSLTALDKGYALHTFLNPEYGYELEDMYVNQQYQTLSGQARLAVYNFDLAHLFDLANLYPYDARTALDLAQVADQAPPEATPNLELEAAAAAATRSLSPLRSEAWYLLVNTDIAAAKTATSSQAARAFYEDAIGAMKDYSALIPTLPRPKLVLAELYLTTGDISRAATLARGLASTSPETLASAPDFEAAIKPYLAR